MSSPPLQHVCFVLPPFEVYSPTRGLALGIITSEVVTVLAARGVRATVVSPSHGPDLYPQGNVVATGYEQLTSGSLLDAARGRLVGWDAPGYAGYVRAVRSAVRAARPEVVVGFNDLVTGGLLARALPRLQVLTWLQNEVITRRRTGLRALHRTDGLLAVSGFIANRAVQAYGPQAPPVLVVPNGVNTDVFQPSRSPRQRPAGAELRCCFVGRIDPNKGPLLAARAVRRAQQRGLDVSIDVAGPVKAWGQPDDVVARYVDELRDTVAAAGGRWCGHVSRPELPAFYRRYDLVFVPSVSDEPFGLVALEAMASGCAVIASNRGGLPEVCGAAARLVDPEDDEAVDAALEAMAGSSGAEWDAITAAARAHAAGSTWSRTVDALLAAIERTRPGPAA
jgi:glycosyltransferase involved in cell wall biosynthesis